MYCSIRRKYCARNLFRRFNLKSPITMRHFHARKSFVRREFGSLEKSSNANFLQSLLLSLSLSLSLSYSFVLRQCIRNFIDMQISSRRRIVRNKQLRYHRPPACKLFNIILGELAFLSPLSLATCSIGTCTAFHASSFCFSTTHNWMKLNIFFDFICLLKR